LSATRKQFHVRKLLESSKQNTIIVLKGMQKMQYAAPINMGLLSKLPQCSVIAGGD